MVQPFFATLWICLNSDIHPPQKNEAMWEINGIILREIPHKRRLQHYGCARWTENENVQGQLWNGITAKATSWWANVRHTDNVERVWRPMMTKLQIKLLSWWEESGNDSVTWQPVMMDRSMDDGGGDSDKYTHLVLWRMTGDRWQSWC